MDYYYVAWITNTVLSRQFLLICILAVPVVILACRNPRIENLLRRIVFFRIGNSTVFLVVLVYALFLAIPFWIDGSNSSIGCCEDVAYMLHSYVASRMSGDSINWNRTIAGGADNSSLIGYSLWSMNRVYALIFEPWQMFTFIVVVNVILVFIFTWKIQVELLGISSLTAFFSSLTLSLIQGYWAAPLRYHVGLGHALAVIPVIIYLFHKYFDSKYIYLMAVAGGMVYSSLTAAVFHQLAPMSVTIALWLLFFRGKNVRRIIFILASFLVPLLLFHAEYIVAVTQLLPQAARSGYVVKTVGLPEGHYWYLAVISAIGLVGASALGYALTKDREIIRHLGLVLTFWVVVPAIAYILQATTPVSYRWHLLYAGNYFIYIIPIGVLVEKCIAAVYPKDKFLALWSSVCIAIGVSLILIVIVLNSMLFGFRDWVANPRWRYLTQNEVLDKIASDKSEPFRIFNYIRDETSNFVGTYQGLESANGFINLIDRKMVDFWWKHLMRGNSYSVFALSPPFIERGDELRDLSGIRVELLKVMNVKYVLSEVPVNDANLELYLAQRPGHDPCDQKPPLMRDVFHGFPVWWRNISCLRRNKDVVRGLYIHKLRDYFPRVYMAGQLRVRPSGLEFSDPDYLQFIGKGNAIVTSQSHFLGHVEDGGFSRTADIRVLSYEHDQITLDINASSKGFVVISDHNNPYWKLKINGNVSPYYTVNLVQTGFFIDKGRSRATFVYCPPFRLRLHNLCRRESVS